MLFWAGLALYGLALPRFDPRQVAEGAGDHWIAGGALAISALADAQLVSAGSTRLYLWNGDDRGVLRAVTVALLAPGPAGYALLLVAEVVWRRPGYDMRRWSTAFPMGMTAAATLSVAAASRIPLLEGPGRVLTWLAVAVWPAVAAGAATGLRSTARR